MKTVTIKRKLVLTSEMFEIAKKALAKYTSLSPITWEQFTHKDSWIIRPDRNGNAYKAEWVLYRDNHRQTIKLNIWLGPDVRNAGKPKPHNHPWNFKSYILYGKGYKQARWVLKNGKSVRTQEICFEGGTNEVSVDHYHEVFALLSESVMTLMITGPVDFSRRWGYLDLENNKHVSAKDWEDPNFKRNTDALNR